MVSKRRTPNILVTGTPGTGKTSTCSLLCSLTPLKHIKVGDIVREKELHDGWDEELECYVLNEDKLCDELEDILSHGGCVVDYHSCDFFPERWFQLVVLLQTDNSVLYDRLTARGYSGKKLQNNIECEIMQVLLEEAHDSYKPEIILPLSNNTIEDMENNVQKIKDWFTSFTESQ